MYVDLEVPFLADHIRALIEAFNSKLVAAEERLVRQIETHLRLQWPDALVSSEWKSAGQWMLPTVAAKSTQRDVPSTLRLPYLRFSVIFVSCMANVTV